MAELLAQHISDDVVNKIRRRASDRGVSPEEEAGRILSEATAKQAEGGPPEREANRYTLFDHFRKLGEIAPDFEFEFDRRSEQPRPLDLG
jgi:plasmid stability protein